MPKGRVKTALYTVADVKRLEKELSSYRRVVCCVDDTDDLQGDSSTGMVAEEIAESFVTHGAYIVLGITRHQLLLSQEIDFTSHNSAMCIMTLMPEGVIERCRKAAIEILRLRSVPVSNPGICFAILPSVCPQEIKESGELKRLVAFGRKAKIEVCTKEEAYELAEAIEWLDLSEYGGTGDGIIGALAGAGLRIEGNDGRLRGSWDLKSILDENYVGSLISVGAFCDFLNDQVIGHVQVLDSKGSVVPKEVNLSLEKMVKPIMNKGALTVVVEIHAGTAYPCKKEDLGMIGNEESWKQYCEQFVLDTDEEERVNLQKRCANCLYRRWSLRGFECVVNEQVAKKDAQETS